MKKKLTTSVASVLSLLRSLWSFGVVTLSLTALLSVVLYRLGAQATHNDLYVTFGVDKAQAVPGETLTYTLLVQNHVSTDIANVVAATSVDLGVTYIAGSGVFYRDNQQFPLPDSWVQDRVNMGTMAPNQENRVTYQVQIPANATPGAVVHSSGQIEAPGYTTQTYGVDTTILAANQNTNFEGGNVFLATNNTQGGGWTDPVSATMGDVIEFKMRIVNNGGYAARNTMLHVQLAWDPQNPSTTLISYATADADNADPLTDSATVVLTGTSSYLWPRDGHYNLVGVTDLYNCPNGCPIPNNFLWGPMNLGTVANGASVEVLFKADIVPIATPTPTPGPIATPTPTPTPGPTTTPTPLQCRNIDIPGGTSRSQNANVTFRCVGNPSSDVTQCRFRFGDGSSEVFEDDCETTHVYSTTGSYDVSCEVRDRNGNWQASNACGSNVEIVSGPTSTPQPAGGPVPTRAQVLSAVVPEEQPETGFSIMGFGILAILGAGLGLLLAL